MSKHDGIHSRPDSRRQEWRGSRDPLDVTASEIIVMVILTVLMGVLLVGAIS